ncbi:MAG: hypothetical protein HeimC3_49680 [Candidatus Heimdallarchaeota archaeon LC_3]|nr:MAG: hypothetical protein HeimC3_49680 [Candidatus Heimdallarchaeota archaeon LC_3]
MELLIRRLESLNFDGQYDIIVRLTQKFLSLYHPYKSTILELQVPFDKYNFIYKYIINEKLPVTFYNTELAISQLFYLETGLFPYCKAEITIKEGKLVQYELQDNIHDINYELPPIRALGIAFNYESTLHLSTPFRATFTPMNQNINTIKKKESFTNQESFTLDRQHSESMFIQMLIQIIDEYDPDVDPDY